MKSLMAEGDTESVLESRTRIYSSEEGIRRDQERVVDAVLAKYPAFDYLKQSTDLSTCVRTGSLEGIKEGIAAFMTRNNIRDMRDVFEHPNGFYHNEFTYEAIKNRLTKNAVLRKKFCDAESPSITEDMILRGGFRNKEEFLSHLFTDECEYIAEIVNCVYVNHILNRKLVRIGELSPSALDDIGMPYEPNFDK